MSLSITFGYGLVLLYLSGLQLGSALSARDNEDWNWCLFYTLVMTFAGLVGCGLIYSVL
jgi:hypothetical protein